VSRGRTLVRAAVLGGAVLAARRRAATGRGGGGAQPRPAAAPLPPGDVRRLPAEDGVALHVVEHGARRDPAATVVLAHGYVQSSRLWAGQVRDLLDARPDLRVVTSTTAGTAAPTRRPASGPPCSSSAATWPGWSTPSPLAVPSSSSGTRWAAWR